MTWELPLRRELRGAEAYGAPQMAVPVRLNVNENPYPPSEVVRRAMAEALYQESGTINRYPDREALDLRSKLADYLGHGLGVDQIWAANGSNEVMMQILGAFGGPGRSLATFSPTYSMYPEYARDSHTNYVTRPRTPDYQIEPTAALAAARDPNTDVIIIATPNNPTGTVSDLPLIKEMLEATQAIVVVDEAYQEFSSHPSALELLADHPNLAVTRTMSKAFAFAGGRLGYVAAAPEVIDALRIVRLPYHLSAITQVVAGVALDHRDEMLAQVAHLVEVRDHAMARLRALGLEVVDSQANFFLFGPFADRHATWTRLVDRGVLVRETGPEPFLRACVGTDQEMDIFFEALIEVLTLERSHG